MLAPLWWRLALGPALPPDQFFRTLVWLLLANALGFVAANSLQRSLRAQFAQSLLLQQLLSTNSLTGIANRRRFDAALEREWRRCRRTGAPLSLLMIDVDHFKPYNDQLGHQQGDEALRQVARLLVDGVGRPGDLVARYGGEEFVCMLPENGMAAALAVANKLIELVRYANIYHPRSPAGARLTISIGVATTKDLSGEPATLMALADKLLYAAKAAGRNQVIVGSLGKAGTDRQAWQRRRPRGVIAANPHLSAGFVERLDIRGRQRRAWAPVGSHRAAPAGGAGDRRGDAGGGRSARRARSAPAWRYAGGDLRLAP